MKLLPISLLLSLLLSLFSLRAQNQNLQESETPWYQLADFGPAHIQTWGDFYEGQYRSDAALKGILLRPNSDKPNLVALFNAETLQFITATPNGVSLDNTPFAGTHGTQNKIQNREQVLFNTTAAPAWANAKGSYEDTRKHPGHGNFDHLRFQGFYRHGNQIVLHLSVHGSSILTMIEEDPDQEGSLRQVFDFSEVKDPLQLKRQEPKNLKVTTRNLKKYTKGGPGLYAETFEVTPQLGVGSGPYLVDHIPLPPTLNKSPYRNKIRLSDFDFFSDQDRAALCTWDGDVWLLSGLREFKTLTWKRYASGLFEPLGLKIVNEIIHVNARDGIWQLIDLNEDDEADHYKVFNYDVLITDNFHEFSFGLETDSKKNFYFAKASPVRAGGRNFDKIIDHNGAFLKVSPDGSQLEVVATGLRAPGGIGVGPNGELTSGENEGTWQPCCKINYFSVEQRPAFLGTEQTRQGLEKTFHEPLCYLPMKVDNSGGSQLWVPAGAKIGLFENELIHLSYGQSALYRVLSQKISNGRVQGGVIKLPIQLSSSAQRAAFHQDGSLYVCGMRGWQTNAASEAGIQRIRYQEKQSLGIPEFMSVKGRQLTLRYDCELDEELATDPSSYAIKRWKYIRGPQYGSGHFSIDHPNLSAEQNALKQESKSHLEDDEVKVTIATLSNDKKTVTLTIPSLVPAQQMQIDYDLESTIGDVLIGTIYSTIHETERTSE